jgi:hypothetical protein
MPVYERTLKVFAEQFLPDEGKIPLGTEVLRNKFGHPTMGRLITHNVQHMFYESDYFCTSLDDTGYAPKQFSLSKEKFERTFKEVDE